MPLDLPGHICICSATAHPLIWIFGAVVQLCLIAVHVVTAVIHPPVGLSNFSVKKLKAVLSYARIKPAILQIEARSVQSSMAAVHTYFRSLFAWICRDSSLWPDGHPHWTQCPYPVSVARIGAVVTNYAQQEDLSTPPSLISDTLQSLLCGRTLFGAMMTPSPLPSRRSAPPFGSIQTHH